MITMATVKVTERTGREGREEEREREREREIERERERGWGKDITQKTHATMQSSLFSKLPREKQLYSGKTTKFKETALRMKKKVLHMIMMGLFI